MEKVAVPYTPIVIVVVIVIVTLIFIFSPKMKEMGVREAVSIGEGGEIGETEVVESSVFGEVKTLPDGTRYIVNPSEIQGGGPPKDGIPSIDKPKFTSAAEVDEWLQDEDLVAGLNYNGVVKAYPLRILNWHEIVNDFANGKPVLITYCPLCRTGIAFDPTIDGKRVEFGTSGKLWNSNLVMYDRETDSYWSQVGGIAIVGELAGMRLEQIPLDTVMWKEWKEKFPQTLVLSRQTGFFRDYDRDPYGGFANSPYVGFGVDFKDTRLFSKAIVYGVLVGDKAKAYSEDKVKEVKILNDNLADKKLLVIWDSELQTVKIFEREFEGEVLEFKLENGRLIDNKGKEWDFDGISDGLHLKRLDTFGLYWFSWIATYPDTELFF